MEKPPQLFDDNEYYNPEIALALKLGEFTSDIAELFDGQTLSEEELLEINGYI